MAPKAAAAPKWCWESDDGFLPYKPKDAQTIEKAYQAAGCTGAAKVNFNGSDYHMDFVAMTQKNLESGKVRRVQRPADLTATPSSSQLTPSLPAVVVSTPPLQAPSVPVLPVSSPAVVPPPTVAVVPPPTVPVPTPPTQAPTEQQQPDAPVGLAAPPASVSVLPAAAPTTITGSGVTWYYTDDFGTEHPFDVRTSAELEVRFLAAAAGDVTPRELKIIGCDYEVDIGYMIITNCWSGDTSCIARRRTPPSPGDKALLLAIEAHVAAAPPVPKRPKRGHQVTYAELCAPPNKKAQAEGSSAAGGGLKAASPVNDLLEVDPHSGKAFNHHVFRVSESNIPYTIRLKQATKFFVAQLLESNDKDTWVVFTRWGKLGAVGQSKADTFTAQNKAASAFASKFREKTKNDWSLYYADQSSFTPVPGKYELATQAEISGGGGWFSVDDDDTE